MLLVHMMELLLLLLLLLLELLLMKGALVGYLVDHISDLVGLISDELGLVGRARTPVSCCGGTTCCPSCRCALTTAAAAPTVRLYPEQSLPG